MAFFLSLDHFLFGRRHRQGSHQRSRLKSKDLDEPEIFLDFLGRGGKLVISSHKHHGATSSRSWRTFFHRTHGRTATRTDEKRNFKVG